MANYLELVELNTPECERRLIASRQRTTEHAHHTPTYVFTGVVETIHLDDDAEEQFMSPAERRLQASRKFSSVRDVEIRFEQEAQIAILEAVCSLELLFLGCSAGRMIWRILWTRALEGDLVLDHVLIRIHDLNLCTVNSFSWLGW